MGLHSSLLRFNLLISSQTQPTQPSQEDGQDLRQRQDSCFRYGQVLERSPLIDIGPFLRTTFIFILSPNSSITHQIRPHKQEWPPKNLRGCLWNNGLHTKPAVDADAITHYHQARPKTNRTKL